MSRRLTFSIETPGASTMRTPHAPHTSSVPSRGLLGDRESVEGTRPIRCDVQGQVEKAPACARLGWLSASGSLADELRGDCGWLKRLNADLAVLAKSRAMQMRSGLSMRSSVVLATPRDRPANSLHSDDVAQSHCSYM